METNTNNYIVNWNDEYLEMQICAGPMSLDAAKQKLREIAVSNLIGYGFSTNRESADSIFNQALSTDDEPYISASEKCVSIIYGKGYEDRWQIVTYKAQYE